MSLFVTGTGTDVGKTVVSALLLRRFGPSHGAFYWKPVATGSANDNTDSETVARLSAQPERVLREAHLFAPPVSPHLAAREAGQPITVDGLRTHFEGLRRSAGPLIVEGAGGLLVPLNDAGETMADLASALGAALLIVGHSGLGTINHTWLTVDAARKRNLPVTGVILNGKPHGENRAAVERFAGVPVIACLPPLDPLSADSIAEHAAQLDAEGLLSQSLEREH